DRGTRRDRPRAVELRAGRGRRAGVRRRGGRVPVLLPLGLPVPVSGVPLSRVRAAPGRRAGPAADVRPGAGSAAGPGPRVLVLLPHLAVVLPVRQRVPGGLGSGPPAAPWRTALTAGERRSGALAPMDPLRNLRGAPDTPTR